MAAAEIRGEIAGQWRVDLAEVARTAVKLESSGKKALAVYTGLMWIVPRSRYYLLYRTCLAHSFKGTYHIVHPK